LITRSTVRLRTEDAIYLRPERVVEELPATARTARDLNALLKISSAIGSLRSVPELQAALFKLILEVIPAEREAILLKDIGGADVFSSVCGWNSLLGPIDSIKVSQTITNQVMREGVALLSNDLLTTEGLGSAPSLVEARICSVLCVPLASGNKTLGVIYLDTSNGTARFDENHLQLITAIASISAAAFENAKLQVQSNLTTIKAQQENVDLANEVYASTQNNYKLGLASLTDLLDSETSLTEAQNNYNEALLQYKLAELDIIKSNGNLKNLLN